MSLLNPRNKFLADPLAVKRFREFVDDPAVQQGIQSVIIEFAQTNPTQEAMRGANHVMDRLVNFTEIAAKVKSWPQPSFQHPSDAVKKGK